MSTFPGLSILAAGSFSDAMAEEPERRSLVGPQDELLPVAGRHVHGRVHPRLGGPSHEVRRASDRVSGAIG